MTAPAVTRSPDIAPAAPLWGRRAFVLLALLLLGGPVAVGAWDWFHPDWPAIPPALQGEALDVPAKDFTLTDLQGRTVRLSDLRGKTVFLNFWATWCPPCVEELPSMVTLGKAMRGRPFEIVAVSQDDDFADVRRFFGGNPPDFAILADSDQQVSQAWGTFKYPETYVIDPDGRVRAKFIGGRPWDSPEAVRWFARMAR